MTWRPPTEEELPMVRALAKQVAADRLARMAFGPPKEQSKKGYPTMAFVGEPTEAEKLWVSMMRPTPPVRIEGGPLKNTGATQ